MSVTWILTNGAYEVSSKEHLLQIMSLGTSFTDLGDSPASYLSDSFLQTTDIDLNSESVTPIGTSASPFAGTYDGASFKISNWSYSGADTHIGLFGFCSGTVKNIVLSGAWSLSATGSTGAGFLVGELDGGSVSNIDSSFSSGTSISTASGVLGGMIGIGRNSSVIQGVTMGGVVSSFSSSNNSGGVVGSCLTGSSVYFVRNIATFETGIDGANSGGVFYIVQDSDVSYVINAMVGDITASNQPAGVCVSLGNGSGNTTDVIVNAMKGNIISESNGRNGGICATLTGRFSTGVFNRLVNYMQGDIISGTRGGLIGVSQIFGGGGGVSVTNSIVATNGSVNNVNYGSDLNPGDTSYNVKRDSSFGMTFSGSSDTSTSASLTGFTTQTEFSNLPYIPFTGTDNEGVSYNWEFVFPNVSGNASYSAYTDVVVSAGDLRVPLEIDFDLGVGNSVQYVSFIDSTASEAFVNNSLTILDSSATTVYDYAGTDQLYPALITALMFTHMVDLSWNEVIGASSYDVDYTENGLSVVVAASGIEGVSTTIYGLNPGSSYLFNVYSDLDNSTPARSITVLSPTVSNESVSSLLVRLSNDLSLIGESAISDINSTLKNVLTTGDVVTTDIGPATFVQDTGTIQLTSEKILTPFDQSAGNGQEFTLVLPDNTSHTIIYNEATNSVSYNSITYDVGDFFIIGTYKIVVKTLV